ncbi:MAG: hypothetical protein ABL986_12955 [Vicinamibacterales bacterium]
MYTSEMRKFEMLVRSNTFGETYSSLFPPTSLGGEKFQALAAAVAQLREHAIEKQTMAKGGRKARRLAREALLAQLNALHLAARGIGVSNPGFEDVFQMPTTRTDAAYATSAHTFLREAERVKEVFARYEMPTDFVAQLTTGIEAFEKACREQQVRLGTLRAARSHITQALDAGMAAVMELDTILRNRLSKDPATLSVWEQARRVDYSRRGRRASSAVAPAAGAAPVVATPVSTATAPAEAPAVVPPALLEKAS